MKTHTKKKFKNKKSFLVPGRNNHEERLNFVKYWANYVKTHSDKEWSSQQNLLIDSQIKVQTKTEGSIKG